jgi:hypothetical protein
MSFQPVLSAEADDSVHVLSAGPFSRSKLTTLRMSFQPFQPARLFWPGPRRVQADDAVHVLSFVLSFQAPLSACERSHQSLEPITAAAIGWQEKT